MTIARKQLGLDKAIVGTAIELIPLEGEHLCQFVPFFQDERVLYYYLPARLRRYDLTALQSLFKDWNNGETDVLLSIIKDGQPIGITSIDNIDLANMNAEIGIALTEPTQRGKGLAKAAITLLSSHLLNDKRLHRLYARVAVGNDHSRYLFEATGFEYEGTLKETLRRPDAYLDMDVLGKVGI